MQEESFPSIPQALFLVLALFLVEYVVGATLYDLRHMLNLSRAELNALVALLGNGVVFGVLLHAKALSYQELFHPTRTSLRTTFILLVPPIALLIPGLVLLASELSKLLLSIFPLSLWEEQAFENMAAVNIAAVATVCLIAPILEEMLFRGVILRAFLVQYPRGMAIAASALIFGLAHMNIYQFIVAFLLGLGAGWLYERSRSLLPCIALHALYNTSLTFADASSKTSPAEPAASASPIIWVLSLTAALFGAVALYWMLGRSRKSVIT